MLTALTWLRRSWHPRAETDSGFECHGPALRVRASASVRTILIAGPYKLGRCSTKHAKDCSDESIVISGTADAFVKEVAGKGVEWLIQLVGSHSPTAQAQVNPRAGAPPLTQQRR
jgi:hypothetical protein